MSGFQLKILALILMVIDHIGYFFPSSAPIWFRFIGRLSMPIFIYLLVEGYTHTKNLKKYINRLFSFGTIMLFMNIIMSILNIESGKMLSPLLPNIFLSMGLCLLALEFRENTFFFIGIVVTSLFTEYSLIPIGIAFVFYIFRDNKKKMATYYIVASLGLSLIFSNWVQLFMVFSIIPILLYNNRKGYSNKFWKYFFYVFYPLHVYLLYYIS